MPTSNLAKSPSRPAAAAGSEEPRCELYAASERLRYLSELEEIDVDSRSLQIFEELLAFAAEAEQTVASQQERIRHLESLSVTDELTGLLNRRGFDAEFSRALARADRSDESGVLILCDLDHFKAVNDTYGHMAGDMVLKAVGAKLLANTRQCDAVARIGGDEFAVLLTQAEPDLARDLADKLCKMLNTLVVSWNDHQIPVSASAGFDVYRAGKTNTGVMLAADRELYARKGDVKRSLKPGRRSASG